MMEIETWNKTTTDYDDDYIDLARDVPQLLRSILDNTVEMSLVTTGSNDGALIKQVEELSKGLSCFANLIEEYRTILGKVNTCKKDMSFIQMTLDRNDESAHVQRNMWYDIEGIINNVLSNSMLLVMGSLNRQERKKVNASMGKMRQVLDKRDEERTFGNAFSRKVGKIIICLDELLQILDPACENFGNKFRNVLSILHEHIRECNSMNNKLPNMHEVSVIASRIAIRKSCVNYLGEYMNKNTSKYSSPIARFRKGLTSLKEKVFNAKQRPPEVCREFLQNVIDVEPIISNELEMENRELVRSMIETNTRIIEGKKAFHADNETMNELNADLSMIIRFLHEKKLSVDGTGTTRENIDNIVSTFCSSSDNAKMTAERLLFYDASDPADVLSFCSATRGDGIVGTKWRPQGMQVMPIIPLLCEGFPGLLINYGVGTGKTMTALVAIAALAKQNFLLDSKVMTRVFLLGPSIKLFSAFIKDIGKVKDELFPDMIITTTNVTITIKPSKSENAYIKIDMQQLNNKTQKFNGGDESAFDKYHLVIVDEAHILVDPKVRPNLVNH